jgi:superfamily II RNA helicase
VPEDHGWAVRPLTDAAGKWTDNYDTWLKQKKAIVEGAAAHKKAVEARRADGYKAPPPPKVRVEDPVARLLRTVGWLEATKQMPALFFVFSRIKCEQLAALVPGSLVDGATSAGARHIMDFHLSRHKDVLEKSPQYHALRTLLLRGIAFHHSGLQPILKEIVEILFSRGFVKVLFATETFSVGLNMPAKVVVFTSMTKMSDGGRRLLRTDEYTQMAGRAGRRGLDVKGLVIYEPMDEPLSETGLRGLLTGSLPPLESRMRFHYDFILKHLLTGGKLQIAEQSYWAVQQKEARSGLSAQIKLAEASAAAAEKTVTEEDVALVAEYNTLCAELNKKKNAAFHKAREALNVWIAAHSGIVTKQTKVEAVRIAHKATQQLIKDAADWDAAPLLAVDHLETFLEKAGFLSKEPESYKLTPLGLLATEVNEGHNLLMPLLSESGRCKDLTGSEIACILAGFLREGGSAKAEEETASIYDAELRSEVTDTLLWIDGQARALEREEDRLRYFSPTGFWDLSPLWVCVTARWLTGVGLTQLASEFEMFEGNIQRGLMRIANLLEEWGSLATLRRDLPMLEKLGALRFLRDEIVVDSLYLRL